MKTGTIYKMKCMALICHAFLFCSISMAQEFTSIPVKNLQGQTTTLSGIIVKGKPCVIDFWATWCHPCIKGLTALNDELEGFLNEVDFQFIAVSIDDSRTERSVAPFVNARRWEFDVYLDPNWELKRAMNIVDIPHTFLLDSAGKIVWQNTTYSEGMEFELFEQIKKIAGDQQKSQTTVE